MHCSKIVKKIEQKNKTENLAKIKITQLQFKTIKIMELENFKKEGNRYTLIPKRTVLIIICVAVLIAGLACLVNGYILGGILIIAFVVFGYFGQSKKYFILDFDKNTCIAKESAYLPEKEYSLDDFEGITFDSISYMGFISISSSIIMRFYIDGKEKRIGVAQSPFKKPMQNLANDIEEIMEAHNKSVNYDK